MTTIDINFIKNNVQCKGTGDIFEQTDENHFNQIYFLWKELNKDLIALNSRRSNLPEILSEGLTAYLFNLARTNNTTFKGLPHSSFDCIDPKIGKTYQIKAVSTLTDTEYGGPTSFGPRSEWDELILAHFICETNVVNFYKFTDNINDIQVNAKETFADQCACGKRPRFSLLKEVLKTNMEPFYTYKFKER